MTSRSCGRVFSCRWATSNFPYDSSCPAAGWSLAFSSGGAAVARLARLRCRACLVSRHDYAKGHVHGIEACLQRICAGPTRFIGAVLRCPRSDGCGTWPAEVPDFNHVDSSFQTRWRGVSDVQDQDDDCGAGELGGDWLYHHQRGDTTSRRQLYDDGQSSSGPGWCGGGDGCRVQGGTGFLCRQRQAGATAVQSGQGCVSAFLRRWLEQAGR